MCWCDQSAVDSVDLCADETVTIYTHCIESCEGCETLSVKRYFLSKRKTLESVAWDALVA